jgi:hypothetical protein
LPPGWTAAASAEELLDFGEDDAPEQAVVLSGRATKDLQQGQKMELQNVGVVVAMPQAVNSANGVTAVPTVKATDIPGAIYRHAQVLERKRREAEAKERAEKEERRRKNSKDDKGRK